MVTWRAAASGQSADRSVQGSSMSLFSRLPVRLSRSTRANSAALAVAVGVFSAARHSGSQTWRISASDCAW